MGKPLWIVSDYIIFFEKRLRTHDPSLLSSAWLKGYLDRVNKAYMPR